MSWWRKAQSSSRHLNVCSSLILLTFSDRKRSAMAAPMALAGPPERAERFDKRLDRLEQRGVIEQGPRPPHTAASLEADAHNDVIKNLRSDGKTAFTDFFEAGALIKGDRSMVLIIGAEQHPLGPNLTRMR